MSSKDDYTQIYKMLLLPISKRMTQAGNILSRTKNYDDKNELTWYEK